MFRFNMNYSVAVAGGVAPRHGNHEEVTWKTTTVKYPHRVRQVLKSQLIGWNKVQCPGVVH